MSNHAERYKPHSHKPANVNDLREHELKISSINNKIAVVLTRAVGTMPCAYLFLLLALIGYPGLHATPQQWVQWISQTLIQLVMLSVIMVGQNQQGHHQELQSEETFQASQKTFKDAETLIEQNNKQFEMLEAQSKVLETHYQELLKQTQLLTDLLGKIGEGHQEMARQSAMLNVALTPRRRPMKQVEGKVND